ncbi:MAG: G8 domain-containing protein [Verrucomicrobia bacterium]|nr:G8 domain-containing protein [Verrucomicrobiota bacterium]
MLVAISLSFAADAPLVRSAKSGAWSDGKTWEGGKLPPAGAKVLVRPGHDVLYDLNSPQPVRSLHICGTLRFATDRDTRLDVGLIKIQAGENVSEEGFDCEVHLSASAPDAPRATLLVGTQEQPVEAKHTALIRLTWFEGMDKQSCPAIVDCGGRMEFHGAPMNRTWVKLGAPAKKGDTTISLNEPVTGWRVGDRVFLTGTTRQIKREKTFRATVRHNTQTEERILRAVSGTTLTLDAPLEFDHTADGAYRGEVANLSRNVIVESADPDGARGHTMFHRGSAGAISYAEFRHLGKEGVLGRYSIHFHLVRDTMRGASVIGASIWDSANRWITIHGTDYLVVRDCVGYQSTGHGFFLEDGTEVFNVLDRNLAVQAGAGKPLPNQVLPFDHNDGAGFWWANSLNTFTRNTAAECDEYGFRFDAAANSGFDLALNVPQPDGSRRATDIRTLPFVRFDDNEIHCMRRHSLNLGGLSAELKGDVGGIGPDARHPFVIRNLKVWNVHWAFHPRPPSVLVDGLDVHHAEYALWKANYDQHAYRRVKLDDISVNPNFDPKGTQPTEGEFPGKLKPVDDLPPVTVITHTLRQKDGSLLVRGTTSDNGEVKRVLVNGREAKAIAANFSQWEITFDKSTAALSAHAEDAAGNVEPRPHKLTAR